MPKASLGDILHFVRRRVLEHEPRSDADLLRLFAAERNEGAFSVLVERHARMVLAVCRRIIGDHHAAEDAFQAVYIILARKWRIDLHRTHGGFGCDPIGVHLHQPRLHSRVYSLQ